MMTAKFRNTVSSNGKQLTTQSNQVFDLSANTVGGHVTRLEVEAFDTSIHISINDESVVHEIDPYDMIVFEDVAISNLKIQENSAQYRYTGFIMID